jgi:phosphatidylserine decarboxylase
MRARAHVLLQHLLPKNLLSAAVYRIARTERRWIKEPLTRWFANAYGVDLSEAELPSPSDYPSFNAFFTRALKPDARPVAGGPETVVAPADGVVTEFGAITGDTLLQAKGMRYSLAELLGEPGFAAERFHDGEFCTIYLAPHNYHRVHMPTDGALVRARYLPGERFSVSRATAEAIPRLFCRNERVACFFDTPLGPLAVVLVGALNVSSISLVHRGEIASGPPQEWSEPTPLPLPRGAELGRFNLGSTVVLVFAPGMVRWSETLADGAPLRMGEAIGSLRMRGA